MKQSTIISCGLLLFASNFAVEGRGKKTKCFSIPTFPMKVESVIKSCQEEVKSNLIEDLLFAAFNENPFDQSKHQHVIKEFEDHIFDGHHETPHHHETLHDHHESPHHHETPYHHEAHHNFDTHQPIVHHDTHHHDTHQPIVHHDTFHHQTVHSQPDHHHAVHHSLPDHSVHHSHSIPQHLPSHHSVQEVSHHHSLPSPVEHHVNTHAINPSVNHHAIVVPSHHSNTPVVVPSHHSQTPVVAHNSHQPVAESHHALTQAIVVSKSADPHDNHRHISAILEKLRSDSSGSNHDDTSNLKYHRRISKRSLFGKWTKKPEEDAYHPTVITHEDRWLAGCLMQCVFRKNDAVDNHGYPTLDGLTDLYTAGTTEQAFFIHVLRAVDKCLKSASVKHKIHKGKVPVKGETCDVAFDVFDCVSDSITEYCSS